MIEHLNERPLWTFCIKNLLTVYVCLQRQLEILGSHRASLEDMLKEMKRKVICIQQFTGGFYLVPHLKPSAFQFLCFPCVLSDISSFQLLKTVGLSHDLSHLIYFVLDHWAYDF